MTTGAMSAFSGGMSLGSSLGNIWGVQQNTSISINHIKQTSKLEQEKQNAQREAIRMKRDAEVEALGIMSNGMSDVAETEKETAKNNVENAEMHAEVSKLVSEVKLARMRRDYPLPVSIAS